MQQTNCSWIWSHMNEPFSKFFKNPSVKMLTDRLVSRHKLFVDDSMCIEKTNQKAFYLQLAHFSFFGPWRGWIVPPHALTFGFCVVLKHSKSWHAIENGNHFQLILKNQVRFPFWCPFGLAKRFFGTIFLIPNIFLKIWSMMFWVKFNFSPNILTVNWWSERTRSWIQSFSSVLEVEGLYFVFHL